MANGRLVQIPGPSSPSPTVITGSVWGTGKWNTMPWAGGTWGTDKWGTMYWMASGLSGKVQLLYDGDALIGEYDAVSGALLRRYVPGQGVDETLVWYEGGSLANPQWLHTDQQGSVVATSNSSGAGTNAYAYGPFGEPKNGFASGGSVFRYTGQMQMAAIGLYYYKARMYDPKLGRFLQTDPVGYGQGLNLYAYVMNDPANATDPTGTCVIRGELVYSGPCEETVVVTGTRIGCGRLGTESCVSFELDPSSFPPQRITNPPLPPESAKQSGGTNRKVCPTGPRANIGASGGGTLFIGILGVSLGGGANVSLPWSSISNLSLTGLQFSGSLSITPLAGFGLFGGIGPSYSGGSSGSAAQAGLQPSGATVLQLGAGDGGGVEVVSALSSDGINASVSGGPKGAFGVYGAFGHQFSKGYNFAPLGCR